MTNNNIQKASIILCFILILFSLFAVNKWVSSEINDIVDLSTTSSNEPVAKTETIKVKKSDKGHVPVIDPQHDSLTPRKSTPSSDKSIKRTSKEKHPLPVIQYELPPDNNEILIQ